MSKIIRARYTWPRSMKGHIGFLGSICVIVVGAIYENLSPVLVATLLATGVTIVGLTGLVLLLIGFPEIDAAPSKFRIKTSFGWSEWISISNIKFAEGVWQTDTSNALIVGTDQLPRIFLLNGLLFKFKFQRAFWIPYTVYKYSDLCQYFGAEHYSLQNSPNEKHYDNYWPFDRFLLPFTYVFSIVMILGVWQLTGGSWPLLCLVSPVLVHMSVNALLGIPIIVTGENGFRIKTKLGWSEEIGWENVRYVRHPWGNSRVLVIGADKLPRLCIWIGLVYTFRWQRAISVPSTVNNFHRLKNEFTSAVEK